MYLTKCTLLVQRSPQDHIDYYTMLFLPPTSLVRQSMQQERVDVIIIKVLPTVFYERETSISRFT